MASEDPNATGFSSRKGRQPPTLDLKAEEVRVDDVGTPRQSADTTSGGTRAQSGASSTTSGADRADASVASPANAEPPIPQDSDMRGTEDASGPAQADRPDTDETSSSAASAAPTDASTLEPADAPELSESASTDTSDTSTMRPDEPPPSQQPPPPPSRRAGGGGLLAALVVGALAGGAAGGGVVYYAAHTGAFLPPADETAALTARLVALENRPVATPQALADLGGKLEAADARLADLSTAVQDLTVQPAPRDKTHDGPAQDGPAQAEATASAPPETLEEDIARLQANSEQALATLTRTGEELTRFGATQSELKARLDTTASQAAEAARQAAEALQLADTARQETGGLSPRLDALAQAATAATAAAQQAEALAPRVALLDTSLADLRKVADATAPRIAALDTRNAALDTRIDEVQQTAQQGIGRIDAFSRAAAGMVVLADLKDAVEAGRPFTAELAAAHALLGANANVLDPLEAAAGKGFTPRAELVDRLEQEGLAAIAGLTPARVAPTDDSLVARLLSSAESLVSIRPADSPDPTGTRGVLARAVAMVRAGALDHALGELRQLPPQVSDRLLTITAEIEARRQAVQLAETLYQQSLAAISGKTP